MDSLTDVPLDLLRSIDHAFKILDWYENLTSEEIPPEWMWSFDDELKEWFEEVKQARDSRYGSEPAEEHEEVPMMDNELAAGRR